MQLKMKQILCIFLYSFLILNVYSLKYTIRVSTSSLYFQPRDGNFKLYLHGIDFMDRIVLKNSTNKNSNSTYIKPFTNYYFDIDYQRQISLIYDVSFYWTLQPPFNFNYLFKPPFIYLNQVSIRPTYFIEDNLYNEVQQLTKLYCTQPLNSALRHKEIVQLVPCR